MVQMVIFNTRFDRSSAMELGLFIQHHSFSSVDCSFVIHFAHSIVPLSFIQLNRLFMHLPIGVSIVQSESFLLRHRR